MTRGIIDLQARRWRLSSCYAASGLATPQHLHPHPPPTACRRQRLHQQPHRRKRRRVERRQRSHQHADRACRFRRQLQPSAVAIRQPFERADRCPDRRTAQRLRHREQRIAHSPWPNDHGAARIQPELPRRRRIKAELVIRDQQRLLLAASVAGQNERQRPRPRARRARQQFDQRAGR
ncbi:MAG: hypothetical protein EXR98_18425 [Gemmataceae bacterium]|nr:hypothetical protein [Gemmataceae bacterium]